MSKSKDTYVLTFLRYLFAFAYIFLMLLPARFARASLVTLLVVPTAFLFLPAVFTKKHNSLMIFIMAYQAVFVMVSFLTGSGDIHTMVSRGKIVLLCLIVAYFLRTNKRFITNLFLLILTGFLLINLYMLIVAPEGYYRDSTVVNQWYTATQVSWFLGGGNNQAGYLFLAIVLSDYKLRYLNKNDSYVIKLALWGIQAICLFTAMRLDSSTTMFCVAALIVLPKLFSPFLKGMRISHKFMLGGLTVFEFLILWGQTSFLAPAISFLFGKNTTFSNRSILWKLCLPKVAQSPIYGHGVFSDAAFREMTGVYAFVNAHNQFLQVMLEGGFVLLICFVGLIITTLKNKNKPIVSYANYAIIAMTCIILQMSFECSFGLASMITFLFLRDMTEENKVIPV